MKQNILNQMGDGKNVNECQSCGENISNQIQKHDGKKTICCECFYSQGIEVQN